MNYTQMAEGFIQMPKEKWDSVQAELTRLTEKYSRVCEKCIGTGIVYDAVEYVTRTGENTSLSGKCLACHGTGRVWMMGVEEVKGLADKQVDRLKIGDEAMTHRTRRSVV